MTKIEKHIETTGRPWEVYGKGHGETLQVLEHNVTPTIGPGSPRRGSGVNRVRGEAFRPFLHCKLMLCDGASKTPQGRRNTHGENAILVGRMGWTRILRGT